MADDKPPAANPDLEDQTPTAKSAEDRKAASALANLDASAADDAASNNVDQDAVNKAMKSLGGGSSAAPDAAAGGGPSKKNVKVDPADVALLVAQLELSRPKATELLKAHDGDVVAALQAHARA